MPERGDIAAEGQPRIAQRRPERVVPGTVRLVSRRPIEIRAGDLDGQSPLAERVEERPWVVAAAILGLFGALWVLSRSRH